MSGMAVEQAPLTPKVLEQHVVIILHGTENVKASYEEEFIGVLEQHVLEQIQGNLPYNIEVNLAVLRYYGTAAPNFARANLEIVRHVLSLALMNLPHTHFSECILLMPTPFANHDPSVQSLTNLEDILQNCNFRQFWETIRTDPGVSDLTKIPGFFKCIRRFIIEVTELTYLNVSLNEVAAQFDLAENSAELAAIMKERQWVVDDSQGPGKTQLQLRSSHSAQDVAAPAAAALPTGVIEQWMEIEKKKRGGAGRS
eukprot:Selendium_serpulae@DN1590_c0_g1_i2.p1